QRSEKPPTPPRSERVVPARYDAELGGMQAPFPKRCKRGGNVSTDGPAAKCRMTIKSPRSNDLQHGGARAPYPCVRVPPPESGDPSRGQPLIEGGEILFDARHLR